MAKDAQEPAKAQLGDTVTVHYTGRRSDDTVFDSSRDREPLEFTIGAGQVIPGFEEAVVGMQPGEHKTATIPADQAYGAYQEDLVLEVDRGQFPPGADPQVGQQFQVGFPDGQSGIVTVREVSGDMITLDANHPLAGEDLHFDLDLIAIG